MPEGPELHLSSRFVQKVGGLRQFTGKIIERLPANRSPRLDDLNSRLSTTGSYTVTSWSRGKELMIAIKPLDLPDSEKYRPEDWSIRFNFGMTGCFKFTRTDELPKHAKVCFTAVGDPACTLSFVDMRGFGRWTLTSQWSDNRGPCILQERDLFRAHVLASMEASAFGKPICELLLDQRYFNGVGNYLRAEALYRLGLAPFVCARDLLSRLPLKPEPGETDVLQMCHQLAAEVVALGGGKRYDVSLDVLNELAPQQGVKKEVAVKKEEEEEEDDKEEGDAFEEWLQCYYQPGMKNLVDHQGRTVWFSGNPGPMVPKARKQRHGTQNNKTKTKNTAESDSSDEDSSPTGKRVKRSAREGRKSARGDVKSKDLPAPTVKGEKSGSRRRTNGKNVAGKAKDENTENLKNGMSPRASRKAAGREGAGVAKYESAESSKPRRIGQSAGQRKSKRLSANNDA